ncbi:MAG: methylmalonyl-CoA mutase family protein [Verrucomicrobiota bacterium]|nr:methylmalonyl-CoA mutase family protein [Verrucomicrobiota bacterium]
MKNKAKLQEIDLHLRDNFASHSYEDWRKAAEELLKGAPFEKALITKTYEGIDLQPLYRKEDIAQLPQVGDLPGMGARVRGRKASGSLATSWDVSQELPYGTPEEFNRAALHDLARGQTELNILLDLATRSGLDPDVATPGLVAACGLSLANLSDLDKALAGIDIKKTPLYFRVGSSGLPVAALLFALAKKRSVPTKKLSGCIEIDPLYSLALRGKISVSLESAFREMALLTTYAEKHAPDLQTIGVQGHVYHDGGANAIQELAFVLATAVEYVREMGKRGVPVNTVAKHLRIAFSSDSNFFMDIAKLRAARLLWSRVIEAFGGDDAAKSVHVHVRTALFNKSRLDPYTNLLRSTSEAFSAVVGGCDSLHVGAFDEVIRVPDETSRRIARNTQIILSEECGLNRVIDPAGGAYYVEWLTDQVARKAWELFQKVESLGGMTKALESGFPQAEVAKMAELKTGNIAKRRDSVVGVNLYSNGKEKPLDAHLPDYVALQKSRARAIEDFRTSGGDEFHNTVMARLSSLLEAAEPQVVAKAIAAIEAGASIGEISRILRFNYPSTSSITPVLQRRASQQFEKLREAVFAYTKSSADGKAPLILQANIGPSRYYRVRADWTTAFFQTGGFEVLADRDFKDAAEIAAAVTATGAQIVVITSSDETYATSVVPVAQAVKAANPKAYVIIAGNPAENEAAWRAAGADDFVNVRVNNYELNEKLLKQLGVL